MLEQIKQKFEEVGPKHISRSVKSNKQYFDFVTEKTKKIKTKNISEALFLVLNNLNEKPKCYCGKYLKFESIIKGYSQYCSVKCARNSETTVSSFNEKIKKRTRTQKEIINKKREKTNNNKYGFSNVSKNCEVKNKKKKTLQKKYGVDSPLQSPEIQEKFKKTSLIKYGVDYPFQSKEIQEKIKQTNIVNYGVENPMQIDFIKQKMKKTNIERYGGIGFQYDRKRLDAVDWDETRKRVKETNIERLGVEYPFQSSKIQQKIKQTNIEKYGVENPFQSDEIKEKIKHTNIEKYGVENPAYSISIKEKIKNNQKKTFFEKMIIKLNDIVYPLFDISEYNGVYDRQTYEWRCVKCGDIFDDHLDNGHIPLCSICYPKIHGMSMMEKELFDIIQEPFKVQCDKTILGKKEIDIYIPDKKIAIEFNGIYWHSELNGKDKNYHLDKTILCNEKDIQLIHVFESEWIENQQIVESIIDAKLGNFKKRIYARKCQIKEISSKEKNIFLEENHLQGQDKSSIKLGLFYQNELVSVMTFGKSRYNKKYQYEMHRFCNKLNTQIIGGASKLFKYFIKCFEPKSVITYADRRYSDGTFYEKIGFEKKGTTQPNYFYFKGNSGLLSRIQFQKHKLKDKLEVFDSELTEWENMQLNGYDRIWDCGNYVFCWNKK